MIKNVLFVLLISVVTVSCSSDDNDESPSSENLIGTWLSTRIETTGCNNPNDNETFIFECPSICVSITFGVDDSFTILTKFQESESIEEGTFSYENGRLTICQVDDGMEECESLNIELDGDVMSGPFSGGFGVNGCFSTQFFDRQN